MNDLEHMNDSLQQVKNVMSQTHNGIEDFAFNTWEAMIVAFGFSVAVGVLAGIFPGLKAARLHPIQALRYE